MSSNDLRIFESAEFGTVRVIEKDGEPWFVASDIALVLGYAKPNNAINEHCKKVNKFRYPNLRQLQPFNIIPESDVYRLIMRSHLPAAERFQDWVVEDILPSIRKRGAFVDEARVDPVFLRQIADELEAKSKALKATQPAVTLCNRMTAHRSAWNITTAAHEVGSRLGKVQDVCERAGILVQDFAGGGVVRYQPTYKAVVNGICKLDGGVGKKYHFTPLGIAWLRRHVAGA